LIRMLADRWTLYGEAIRSRNLEKAEKIIAEVDEVDRAANRLMHSGFTELRQVLSKRYALAFPHYEPDRSRSAASGKDKKSKASDKSTVKLGGKANPEEEKTSESRLRIAKQLVKAKKFDGARKHLNVILKDHADSDEAQEAARLLDQIEGKRDG